MLEENVRGEYWMRTKKRCRSYGKGPTLCRENMVGYKGAS